MGGDDFDPGSVAWVLDSGSMEHLIAAVWACDEAVVDLETTGLFEHATTGGRLNGGVAARVSLASLTLPTGDDYPVTWVLPLSHPESPWSGRWRATLREVALAIVEADRPLVNQNVKFDAKWVRAVCGVDLSRRIVWDTQMASHLLDEVSSTRLKDRAPKVFGVRRWDDFDLSTPGASESVPLFDLGMYAARDTYWTWRLAGYQRRQMFVGTPDEVESPEEILDARLGRLATWVGMPMVATLTAVEQRGIALDVDWCRVQRVHHLDAAGRLSKALANRYPDGPDPAQASFAPTSYWFRDFTECAIKAGELTVAAMTPTGRAQWSKGVLVRQQRAGSVVAGAVLAIRGHLKRAEYLTSWLDHVSADGAIHTTYHAARVITGRLSSESPNMQQVTAALKPAFVPRSGYYLAELDYSQIELRVAAMISGCVPMIEAFVRGDDLHRLLAARITGKNELDVTPDERQAGKSANFGLLYGIGVYGFQQYAETVYGVSFTTEEAHAVHRAFFDTWVGMREWHVRTVARAEQRGYVTSPIGRVRRLPGIAGDDSGYSGRAAINAPVQGFASDLMQTAASSIEGTLPGHRPVRGARIVGTVHDSIVVEVPTEGWEDVVADCMARMLDLSAVLGRLDCELSVPLAVEVKVGTRWGLADVGSFSDSDLIERYGE